MLKLRDVWLERFPVSRDIRDNVLGKISTLLHKVNAQKKSLSWRMRAKAGTRMRWYSDVEERSR
jgi:hypothetical protein